MLVGAGKPVDVVIGEGAWRVVHPVQLVAHFEAVHTLSISVVRVSAVFRMIRSDVDGVDAIPSPGLC